MTITRWILADAEDRRPRDHIIAVLRSESGLIHEANEYVGEKDKIKTLDDLADFGLCFYFYTEGQ